MAIEFEALVAIEFDNWHYWIAVEYFEAVVDKSALADILLALADNNMALRFVVVADKNMALAQNFVVDDKSVVGHKKKAVDMKLVADNISALIADILEIVEELDYKNMVA